MASSIAVTLYRSLLRSVRSLDGPLRLRLPLSASGVKWLGGPSTPQYAMLEQDTSHAVELLPWLKHSMQSLDQPEIAADTVRDLLRAEFRREVPEGVDILDRGLEAMRVLSEAAEMATTTSVSVSRPIDGVAVRTEATSAFRGRDGASGAFVFEYRVRVANVGATPVQVVGRTWLIRNQDGSVHANIARSPGIVGQTPRLQPGQAFEYASGTTLKTPGGSVVGSLQMTTLDLVSGINGAGPTQGAPATPFDAEVDEFNCAVPGPR